MKGDDLREDLRKMLEDGTINDVKIVLMDGELKANKDVLMARCDYFDTMFTFFYDFSDGGTRTIQMLNVRKEPMEKVLKYIFTGEHIPVSPSPSLDLEVLGLLWRLQLNAAFERFHEDFYAWRRNILCLKNEES